jgi:hypothetical protein
MLIGAGKIPYRKFAGHVKRIRLDELEGIARRVIELAFPLFIGADDATARQRRVHSDFYGGRQLRNVKTRRRFSGGLKDELLPRGRYHTVCTNPKQQSREKVKRSADWGLLASEFGAYGDWTQTGPALVVDWSDECEVPMMKDLRSAQPTADALFVMFMRQPGEPGLIDLIFREKDRDSQFDNDDWGGGQYLWRPASPVRIGEYTFGMAYGVNVHYKVEELRIDRVVDLRYPEVQAGFVRAFCPSLADEGVSGFLRLLPALLDPRLGGSVTTDLIGLYLRTHGAQALIYPSARFNTWVKVEAAIPTEFGGWNLVDYRDAPPCSHLPTFDPSLFWADPGTTVVELPPEGSKLEEGSWKIRGAMQKADKKRMVDLQRYAAGLET